MKKQSLSSNEAVGQHKVLPKKIGVLVINLGSPTRPTAASVKIFLREFLSDPRVVPLASGLPNLFWWPLLRFVILPIRSPKSAKKYRAIWRQREKLSPLHYYTDSIAQKLQTSLGKNLAKNIIVRSAYRYGDRPANKNLRQSIGGGSIETEIKNLQSLGCRRVVILPLYPHYSSPTTASIIDDIGRVLKKMQHQPIVSVVPPYFDHVDFIALLKKSITDFFKGKKMPEKIIVSNHGIPQSFVKKGDPYSCQAKKTTRLLRESLKRDNNTMLVAFQSRFGANEWVKPYCVDVVKQLAADNCQSLAIVSPSFAVDCLETLEEINMELRNDFFKHHAAPDKATKAAFHYIPALTTNQGQWHFIKNCCCRFYNFKAFAFCRPLL